MTSEITPGPESRKDVVRRLSHKHDAIIDWMLLYPERKLADCAECFGISKTWLHQLVNSDMFMAEYRKRAQETRGLVVHELRNQIAATAATAMDEVVRKIETGTVSERFLGDTLKTTLTALGYGVAQNNAAAGAAAQVTVNLDASSLVEARERAAQAKQGTTPARLVVDVEGSPA